jgi:hypothetical protein
MIPAGSPFHPRSVSHKIHPNMRFLALAAAFLVAGCGGSASMRPAAPPPCATRVIATHPADTVTVVVFDKIDLTHAPAPRNREERFVFSHLYETLVKVDCRGMVQPGLARSWKKASDGWYIELQEDAHFRDNIMVTMEDVKASLEPAIRDGLAMGPIDVVDETHAIIHGDFDIKLLAIPMLAIRKESASGVPVGTGAWTIDASAPGDDIVMHPVDGRTPVVRIMQKDRARAMDIASGSADAMITDDPAVFDYAPARTHSAPIPLTWDRAYVLVDPVRIERAAGGGVVTALPRGVCDALARDAVSVDARGGSSIFADAWNAAPLRMSVDGAPWHASPSSQVVFASADPVARALAERIVALAAMDTSTSTDARALRRAMPGAGPGLRATGMTRDMFLAHVHDGPNDNLVLPLSWLADYPLLVPHLFAVAPWIALNGNPFPAGFVPLVETRAHFIALSDRISYIDEKNGTVHIMPPGAERVR